MKLPAVPSAPKRHRLARAALVAAAIVLALPVLAWATAGLWAKPAIRHYVMSHSGRRFDVDTMSLRFAGSLDPTVEFRGLEIQNAPWAAPRPLIRAKRVAATFDWRSLFGRAPTVVTLLVLEDAQVDLERQADGLRNWRLGHPEDRGPPRVRVAALDARDSTLFSAHRGIGLEGEASIAALAAARPLAEAPALPLTRRLSFHGRYQGRPFDGATDVSDVLTFGLTAQRFAFDGHARMSGLRVDAHGLATDLHAAGDADFDARLASDGDGDLWPLPLREGLARVRPLAASAHVVRAGATWTLTGVQLALGRHSRAAGELRVVDDPQGRERRQVQATVRDALLDVADLRALGGPATGTGATARTPPDEALALEKLRAYDAVVDVRDARFANSERALVQSLALHASLAQGVLKVDALDLGAAGGHVTGTLEFDASRPDGRLALALQARGLRLEQLSEKLAATHGLEGALEGRANLRAQGRSPHALVRDAAGTMALSLAPGASVTQRVDAKLGLDGGEWLRTLFDRSGRVPVECASLTLDVSRGVATSRRLAFETARTALAGHGSLDLADQTLDAELMPIRKERALLALDRSLHASGSWNAIHVALGPPLTGATADPCPR